jgi:hypothetical protein
MTASGELAVAVMFLYGYGGLSLVVCIVGFVIGGFSDAFFGILYLHCLIIGGWSASRMYAVLAEKEFSPGKALTISFFITITIFGAGAVSGIKEKTFACWCCIFAGACVYISYMFNEIRPRKKYGPPFHPDIIARCNAARQGKETSTTMHAKVRRRRCSAAARIESSTMTVVAARVPLNCPNSSARAATLSALRKMATLNVIRSRYVPEMSSNAVASAML